MELLVVAIFFSVTVAAISGMHPLDRAKEGPYSCGSPSPESLVPKIYGGRETNVSEFPWLASVICDGCEGDNGIQQYRHICGGSLITDKYGCVEVATVECKFLPLGNSASDYC